MTETILEIDWQEPRQTRTFTSIYARFGVPLREQQCRYCGAVLYSRRQSACGVCARPLPESVRFSDEQRAIVSSVFKEERARHRQWLRSH